jgi:hypothetical protein
VTNDSTGNTFSEARSAGSRQARLTVSCFDDSDQDWMLVIDVDRVVLYCSVVVVVVL